MLTKTELNNHGGKFRSLIFREGSKIKAYCAKIVKITDHTITFRCQNSKEVIKKNLSSLVES